MAQATAQVKEFRVPDMSCDHCKKAITQAVSALSGVSQVNVDLGAKKVTVTYNADLVGVPKIKEAIEEAGYTVE